MKPKKTITIPEEGPAERKPAEPFILFAGGDSEGRDVTQPVGYDEHGNPLYAPQGFTFRIP